MHAIQSRIRGLSMQSMPVSDRKRKKVLIKEIFTILGVLIGQFFALITEKLI